MVEETTERRRLSATGRKALDWKKLNDVTAGARRRSAAAVDSEPGRIDPDRVREIFRVAREEFRSALGSLRRLTYIITWLVAASAVAAVVGLLLAVFFDLKVPGAVTSLASLGTLLGLIYKMWQLGRDQAMLELIPARYEVALTLANSPEQFSRILDLFLTETESLRRAA